VKANGGRIRREKMEIPGVGWFAGATDTEGNRLGLMQPTGWKAK
jgi:predicted enzyme related to lactoylglutathione lyase